MHSIEIVRRYHFISTRSLIQPVIHTLRSVVPNALHSHSIFLKVSNIKLGFKPTTISRTKQKNDEKQDMH